MIPVVGLGASGHARVILEMLQAGNKYEVVALLDSNRSLWGTTVAGVPVIGGDQELEGTRLAHVRHFFIGIGSVRNTAIRRLAFERALQHDRTPIVTTHSRAIVSPLATLGDGTVVMAGAIVNPGARLGANVIVNTGAIVEHDCQIGAHTHIATGARLAGGVHVGHGVHVGVGATIRQGIAIGDEAVIGAGAVVVHDVPPAVLVVGVPARQVSERDSKVGE